MAAHCQTQHGVEKGGPGQEGYGEVGGEDPRTYRIVFPTNSGPGHCPVEGCSDRPATRNAMRVHLWHQNFRDTMLIME